jgi:hypothetical protein
MKAAAGEKVSGSIRLVAEGVNHVAAVGVAGIGGDRGRGEYGPGTES